MATTAKPLPAADQGTGRPTPLLQPSCLCPSHPPAFPQRGCASEPQGKQVGQAGRSFSAQRQSQPFPQNNSCPVLKVVVRTHGCTGRGPLRLLALTQLSPPAASTDRRTLATQGPARLRQSLATLGPRARGKKGIEGPIA